MEILIDAAKKSAVNGMEMFLRNFSKVPDERLHWSPAPTAKTPIRVAAHTALYAGRFAEMIREQKLPAPDNLEEWLAQRNAEEVALTDRAEIEAVFRRGTEEVFAALDTLTPEALGSTLDSMAGFSLSMKYMITMPGWHATLHTGQIDFLQTCWGDEEIYF